MRKQICENSTLDGTGCANQPNYSVTHTPMAKWPAPDARSEQHAAVRIAPDLKPPLLPALRDKYDRIILDTYEALWGERDEPRSRWNRGELELLDMHAERVLAHIRGVVASGGFVGPTGGAVFGDELSSKFAVYADAPRIVDVIRRKIV